MGCRNKQAAFIAGHVVSSVKKKCIKPTQVNGAGRHKIRKHSFKYYLTLSDQRRVEVCKNFLCTHCLLVGKLLSMLPRLQLVESLCQTVEVRSHLTKRAKIFVSIYACTFVPSRLLYPITAVQIPQKVILMQA